MEAIQSNVISVPDGKPSSLFSSICSPFLYTNEPWIFPGGPHSLPSFSSSEEVTLLPSSTMIELLSSSRDLRDEMYPQLIVSGVSEPRAQSGSRWWAMVDEKSGIHRSTGKIILPICTDDALPMPLSHWIITELPCAMVRPARYPPWQMRIQID